MEKKPDDLLSAAAQDMGIPLQNVALSLFAAYHRELIAWNEKMNLISETTSRNIPIKHFIDSLTPLPFMPNPSARMLDIGSGAGFPGIPLKIAAPSLSMCLVESSRKKTSFLKHIIRTLALADITVIHNRVESLMEDERYGNSFDIVISRATMKLSLLLHIGSRFLNLGGMVVAMKGNHVADELQDAVKCYDLDGLAYVACHEIRLPVTQETRNIVLFKKVRQTG